MVPLEVADYLEKNGLVERLRKEFGLEILSELIDTSYMQSESLNQERAHTWKE